MSMKTLGFFIAFMGWLTSIEGYTAAHIGMILVGTTMFLVSFYLEHR